MESQESETLDTNQDLEVLLNYFNRKQSPWQGRDKEKPKILREILFNASGGELIRILRQILKPEEMSELIKSENDNLSPAMVEELSQDIQIRRKTTKHRRELNFGDVKIKHETSIDLGK